MVDFTTLPEEKLKAYIKKFFNQSALIREIDNVISLSTLTKWIENQDYEPKAGVVEKIRSVLSNV